MIRQIVIVLYLLGIVGQISGVSEIIGGQEEMWQRPV